MNPANPVQPPYDVVTMGRIGVDIYPQQTGVGLEDVETFGKYLGGSATNVAVAAARYGRSVGILTGVGDDPFGRYCRRALTEYGVSTDHVTTVAGLPTPVTFCEIFPPDHFPIYFYRRPSAPDLEITLGDAARHTVQSARILWTTVTGLCKEPSRTSTLEALALRGRGAHTVLDLDYRPIFWRSAGEAGVWVRTALSRVSVAVGNIDEAEVAVGTRDAREAARRMRALGVRLAIVKRGRDGVLAVDDEHEVEVPAVPVQVVNGLGAGDAFGGALCHALLSGLDTATAMRFGNAAGAIVASRLACSAAMPTESEVQAELAKEAS